LEYLFSQMTRQEAIAAAPDSRRGYWYWLCLNVGLALVLFFTLKFSAALATWPCAPAGVVCLGALLQAAERIFLPVQAARRSAHFSAKTKERLLLVGYWLGLVFIGGFLVLLSLAIYYHSLQRLFAEAMSLNVSNFIVRWFFCDLAGVKPAQEPEGFGNSPPLRDLHTLQSAEWGESAPSKLGS
jgi:hypothetical protein